MGEGEIVVVGLLVAVAGLSVLARRLSLPYPIVLVLGGALLGFVPGLPQVRLDPEVVLLIFLPPLLYGSSIFANFNDFRGDLRWLALNTVGLVLATMGSWPGSRTPSSPAYPGPPPLSWGRLCRRPIRWRRRPSCGASASPAAWSARSRARACSTTPPPWSPTGSPWLPWWPGASRWPRPGCGSSSARPAGWPSAWSSGGWSPSCASAPPTLRSA